MQHLAGTPEIDIIRIITQLIGTLLRLDRWNGNHLPIIPGQHVTDQIILMKPLHDDHDRAGPLVIEARQEGVVEGLVDPPTLLLGQGVGRLDRVVNDDEIGAAARGSSHSCRRHSDSPAGS